MVLLFHGGMRASKRAGRAVALSNARADRASRRPVPRSTVSRTPGRAAGQGQSPCHRALVVSGAACRRVVGRRPRGDRSDAWRRGGGARSKQSRRHRLHDARRRGLPSFVFRQHDGRNDRKAVRRDARKPDPAAASRRAPRKASPGAHVRIAPISRISFIVSRVGPIQGAFAAARWQRTAFRRIRFPLSRLML